MEQPLQICIEQALAGDHLAFEALIRQYSRLVFSQAMQVLHDEAEAEDVCQEVFIKAYRHRTMLKDSSRFASWLLAITRNLCRDRIRRRRTTSLDDEQLAHTVDSKAADPASELEQQDTAGLLRLAVRLLPERQQLAIELFYFEEMDYRSIQDHMGISRGALRGILNRGREGLRHLLHHRRQPDQESSTLHQEEKLS